ncbi:PAS domain S-box protein [Phormidium sp. FACHB-592]|uniref:histidine kinase n=1 Tax=Stenomitos frigidus AS-A4 TaxID=2933935 RepID=A0ABV0KRV7_9CYAN|nr:PAS domain S-box protein [Phormidium sp. FACHB-592]MBD2074215.1 PAS domain S-box protein [Phormidium sp. FACHB-592]
MLNKVRRINPYAVAVLSVFTATILTQLLYPLLTSMSFALFYAAVAITAWVGGARPGLIATFLSILSICYFFLPPIHLFAIADPGNFLRLVLSALVASLINYLISALRNAQHQIQQLSDHRLKESEEQLELAMQAAHIGIWNWDLVTGKIVWTPQHEQLLGLAPGTFDGRYETFDARLHPDDREGLNRAVQTAIEGQSIYQHEYRIIWADGSIHWVEGRGQTFYDGMGQPIRVTGTLMNIDDRKQAEEALRLSEERYRSLVEATTDSVWLTDAQGNVLRTASLWTNLTGQALDETSEWDYLKAIHPDDRDHMLQVYSHCLATGDPYAIEYRVLSQAGECYWLAVKAVPVYNLDGSIREWIGTFNNITERRTAETILLQAKLELEQRVADRTTALQQTSQLLNNFFSAASSAKIGLCIHDQKLRFVQINEALAAINGHSVADHLGRTTTELLPELAATVTPLHEQVLTTGQPIIDLEMTTELPSHPGVTRYWLASYFPILSSDSDAQTVGVGVIVTEISARKQAENALTKELVQSKALFKASFDGIVVLNQQGYVIDASESFARMLGYSLEETLALHVVDWDAQWTKEELIQIVQTAELVDTSFETLHRRKDGALNEVEITVSEVKSGEEVLQLCICRDISDRKRAEAILVEADRRWRSLLDNVQLVVVGLDHNGTVEYVNPFFLQLTGYTEEEVLGHYWFDHFLMPGQKPSAQVCFQEVLEKEFHPYYQNSIVTKLGEERMIAWSNTLLRNAEGKPISTISIGEDITERHRLEQMKAEFISIVSHELRTPLTSISGALELLSTGLIQPESDRGQETIGIAATEADRLTRLVNDILDLERLESGKIRLECQPWDLAQLMTRAVDFMQLTANQTGITLLVEPLSVTLEIDGDRILQVLTNLLSNAVKFSPNHSTIWLTAEIDREHHVLLTVRDQGRGIPANKLENIFERFQQVDASDSRKKGGTGLGLAICRSIVQQHGGAIWAESVLEQGSRLHFTLPLTTEA